MKVLINYANTAYRKAQRFNTLTGIYFARFDMIIEFSPQDIEEDFLKRNNYILSQERGNGLWLWKPYIINKTLQSLEYGDFLFYCDSGSFFIRNIETIINSMGEEMIWVSDLPLLEEQFTSKYLIEKMNCIQFNKTNQIQAGFIGLIKCEKSLKFVDEWLKLCCNPDFLEVKSSSENTNFIDHREDQSILSLLCKKHNIKPHLDPTQYGNFPLKYFSDKYEIVIPDHDVEYKPSIVLHRSKNCILITCLKEFIYAIVKRKTLEKIIYVKRILSKKAK